MKKKKQIKTAIFLILVLIAAIISYLCLINWNKTKEKEEDAKNNASINVYPDNFDSSNIKTIKYTVDGKVLSFSLKDESNDNDTYQYDGDKDYNLNQSSIKGMFNTLSSLTASRKVKDNNDENKDFGISDSSSYVTAIDKNGNSITIYFGNTNTNAEITYISVKGVDGIFTISSDISSYYTHSLSDLKETESETSEEETSEN